MNTILIKNVKVLGYDLTQNILAENGVITKVSSDIPSVKVDKIYDFEHGLLTPALVNVHTHLDKSNLSEVVVNESGSIGEARSKLLAYKSNMTVEDIKERAREVVLDSLKNGVLFLRTHVDVDPIIGLKSVIALNEIKNEFKDLIKIQIVAFPQEGISEAPGTFDLLDTAMSSGADLIGGHLSIAKDFGEHSERMFELAEKHGCDIDVHVDYDIDRDYSIYRQFEDGSSWPKELGIVDLAMCKKRRGFKRQVTASHLCGLSAANPEDAKRIIDLIYEQNINVVALAPNNMYCNGRNDRNNIRRGVTLVKPLIARGINTSFGPDNIRDAFNPLGSPDMIINGIITAYACHFSNRQDYENLFNMFTYNAAKIMGLQHYGVTEGCNADFTIFRSDTPEKILARAEKPIALFRRGELVFSHE